MSVRLPDEEMRVAECDGCPEMLSTSCDFDYSLYDIAEIGSALADAEWMQAEDCPEQHVFCERCVTKGNDAIEACPPCKAEREMLTAPPVRVRWEGPPAGSTEDQA